MRLEKFWEIYIIGSFFSSVFGWGLYLCFGFVLVWFFWFVWWVVFFFCKPRKLYTKVTFKEAKVIKSRIQDLENCVTKTVCTQFFDAFYTQTVQLPAHGTISDRAECPNHPSDD